MKKLLIAIGVVSLLAGVFTALSAKSNTLTTRNCYSNAVVKCGTFSQSELNSRITSSGKAAYKHYGISTNLSGTKTGTLKSNGDIVVSGKVVATGAQSVGRGYKAGTKNLKISGTAFHESSARQAFLGYDTPVYVFFNTDGSFKNAIAKICGNPIIAKPTPKPVYNCDSIVAIERSRTSFEFKVATTTKNGAKYKNVTFIVKDAKGKVVSQTSTTGKTKTVTVKTPGKYTVEAKTTFEIPFKAGKKTVSKTDAKCKKPFTVKPEPVVNIKVCELSTKKVITIDQKKFDSKKHSKNLDDCKTKYIKVCELDTKKVITIDEDKFDSKKHSKNLDDCAVAYKCTGTTVKTLSRTTREFATSYTLKNATHIKTSYIVRDSKGVVVQDSTSARFTAKKAGTYTVQAVVSVKETASGKVRTITAPACKKSFTVAPEPINYIHVCDLKTFTIIKINEKDFDSKKHSKEIKDCVAPNPATIVVCELDTKKIISIAERDFDSKKHSKNLDDCKEVVKTIEVCDLDTKKTITIDEKDFDETKHSTDKADCKTKTIEVCDLDTGNIITIDEDNFDDTKHSTDKVDCDTPEELPTTGAGDFIAPGLGLGSLIAAFSYYAASRRNLLSAFLGK